MGRQAKNEAGNHYGRLTVIRLTSKRSSDGSALWLCRCACGTLAVVNGIDLRAGNTKSCGCLQREMARTHGEAYPQSVEYRAWQGMLRRCYNTKTHNYDRYGGRGIIVCDRWNPKQGGCYENFLADVGRKPSQDEFRSRKQR